MKTGSRTRTNFILWVVTGSLLLAALLVAALFWVCGSAPSPMPTSGVVCRHARDLGLQRFEYALDGFIALESDGMDRHVLAGSLFLGTGEQASGRVDVPSKDIQQQAAAARMGSGLYREATKGVQICQSCQESSAPPVIPVCSILVRTL